MPLLDKPDSGIRQVPVIPTEPKARSSSRASASERGICVVDGRSFNTPMSPAQIPPRLKGFVGMTPVVIPLEP